MRATVVVVVLVVVVLVVVMTLVLVVVGVVVVVSVIAVLEQADNINSNNKRFIRLSSGSMLPRGAVVIDYAV